MFGGGQAQQKLEYAELLIAITSNSTCTKPILLAVLFISVQGF